MIVFLVVYLSVFAVFNLGKLALTFNDKLSHPKISSAKLIPSWGVVLKIYVIYCFY